MNKVFYILAEHSLELIYGAEDQIVISGWGASCGVT